MMTKTRRRKWWSIGDKSSVCEINLFCSRCLKLHSQCLVIRSMEMSSSSSHLPVFQLCWKPRFAALENSGRQVPLHSIQRCVKSKQTNSNSGDCNFSRTQAYRSGDVWLLSVGKQLCVHVAVSPLLLILLLLIQLELRLS
jgi:hypothetical protein